MKNAIKITVTTIVVALISSCGGISDEEIAVYKVCANSVKHLDIYQKDGTHFSKTDVGKDFKLRICLARAELYIEGYRIGKTAKESDYKVYQLYLMSDRTVYDIYKELIKSGIEP